MKKLILLALFLCFANYVFAEEIDSNLTKHAVAILRVEYKNEAGVCEKYCWQKVRILKILKNESDYNFPEFIEVAYYSWEKGIPIGLSTVYLEKYNSTKNDLWKLVGGKVETGVSHFTEQNRAAASIPVKIKDSTK